MIEDGDVVEIDYVGRVQSTGEVFDLTSEETAAEEGYDTDDLDLGAVKVLIGAEHVIPGLEEAIRDMEEGEERTVQVAAEDAFGERSGDAIETFAEGEFEEYDITPRRGLVVEVDGRRGKIVSTSSGRVRVDFNHPLAGDDLEYDVTVRRVVDDIEDRVDAVLGYYGLDELDPSVTLDDGDLSIGFGEPLENQELREQLENDLALVSGVETVEIE